MRKKLKIGTTLFSALMAAMIIASATLTVSAKTEQADTSSEIDTQESAQDTSDSYMLLGPQEKLVEKFESIPEIQVIDKYVLIEDSDTPTSLVGIDAISIKHALIIDGKENDMLRTFDNPENAINQIYGKSPVLLETLASKYSLDRMNNENWKQYREKMVEYVNECIAKEDDSYSAIVKEERSLDVFFDIYENTEQNEDLIAQINGSRTRSAEQVTVGQLVAVIPNTTPLVQEVNAIRAEEKLEQTQKQLDEIQTRGADVARYFNVNIGRQYALNRATNPYSAKYGYFGGNDCTNFVSQIMHEGGMPLFWGGAGWWYMRAGNTPASDYYYSDPWINANAFCNAWYGIDYKTTVLYDFSSNLREGDFIAFDGGRDGSYDHVGFVAWLGTYDWHTNKYGHNQYYRDFVVAQHTSNYQAWVSSSINGWDNLEDEHAIYARVWTR